MKSPLRLNIFSSLTFTSHNRGCLCVDIVGVAVESLIGLVWAYLSVCAVKICMYGGIQMLCI